MNRIKAWVRAFFGFSRTETHAFLILLPLMALLIFTEPVYQYWFTHQPQDFSSEARKLDSLLAQMKWEEHDSSAHIKTSITLFAFDPNRISSDSLEMLGFDSRLAKRIINYRNKGGKFYSIKDLKKMYGMDSSWLKKMQAFITFPIKSEIRNDFQKTAPTFNIASPIDLNIADTAQLKSVYGIGSKLSARVVTYRNKLGGFISWQQVNEIYGLDSSVVETMKKKFLISANFLPKQIDLNAASEKDLSLHPYIKSKLAQAIVAYRHQHGPFQQVEDLKRITVLKEEAFEKIKPYLSVNP